jgi:outer membrane protein
MAFAQAGAAGTTKVGVINIQSALIGTRDGQKAAQELDAKRAPKQKELESKQNTINQLRDQLNKGSNTMAPDARTKLVREIDQRTTSLNRDLEDAQAEFEQDQQKILNDLGQRIMTVIDKYARDNGYTLILDVSSPQTPVLYATNQIDITQEIIKLYDAQAPAAASAPASRPASAQPVAAPKPTGIAPAKKK